MRFSLWAGMRGDWEALRDLGRHVEATGWDGLWVADHFASERRGVSQPIAECWTTLAALATAVPRVRLGPMVSGNTYRHPAVLANMAATVDIISGGRVVLGIGSAWQEYEHQAYGIPFYTTRERLERLEEACQVLRGLLDGERTTFQGKHYQLDNAPLNPKPVQRPMPLLIGGGGERVTLRIVAQYADEWNYFGSPDYYRAKAAILDRHCVDVGRDPAAIKRQVNTLILVSDDPEAVEAARAARLLPPQALAAGTVDEMRRVMQEYAGAGVDEIVVQIGNLGEGAQRDAVLDRFISEVASEFR